MNAYDWSLLASGGLLCGIAIGASLVGAMTWFASLPMVAVIVLFSCVYVQER